MRVIRFVAGVVEASGADVGIDWHGHRDRGLGLANVLAAIAAGASRVHGCGLGIGERAGNAPMDLILVNLKLLGWIDRDLTGLGEYCRLISEGCRVPIPSNYPVVGRDAFETGTGVHAAAVIKALRKNDPWLADRVYSGVPASDFGFSQKIRIGPMSGRSNIVFWLERRGMEPKDEVVDRIYDAAKRSDRLLEDDELLALAAPPRSSAPRRRGESSAPGAGLFPRLDADAVAARVLRPVESLVGAADEGLEVTAVLGEVGDADTDGDADRDSLVGDGRLLDGPSNPLGRPPRLVGRPLG
jgi:isopropylmalate/homocitrate/citramalate synthase